MAESYPLPFGGGFSLPQLLLFAASPLPCAGPRYRSAGQAMLRIALGGRPAAAPYPGEAGGPAGRLSSCTLLPDFSPLRVLLPSPAR